MNGFFRVTERLHLAFVLMTELGGLKKDERASLREIAGKLHIRDGYLEEVAATLKSAGLIEGRAGRSGGYRLAKTAGKVRLREIVTAIEGPVALVFCQAGGACPIAGTCASKSVWGVLQKDLIASLDRRTLADAIG